MVAIRTDGLHKRYGEVTALRDLDLTVEEGEIYGLLGPNGAGKSSLINILLDFNRPTGGSAQVLGFDSQTEGEDVRRQVGVLPEGYGVYGRLTGREHVEFVIDSKDANADVDALLERVGIAEAADRKASGYSKGMGQRLALAMALVDEPDLLILDEPTTGLDPNGAREIREIVREENERGATVFFSSHILGQVENVCDRVGVLQDGRLVAEDTIEGLREARARDGQVIATVEGSADGVPAAVESVAGVSSATADGNTITIGCADEAKLRALNAVEQAGATVVDLETRDASLEDLFADITTEIDRGDSDEVDEQASVTRGELA